MTRGRDVGTSDVAGGPAPHIPVLARRAIEFLAPRDDALYVDGTFGAGGHTRLILAAANSRVIGVDRDRSAIALGAHLVAEAAGRLFLAEDRLSDLEALLASRGVDWIDGLLIDLGVSSMQLDQAERGFSFRRDGPLDMRMDAEGPTAADLVAVAPEATLAAIIRTLGEERHARAVARAIVRRREQAPIRTTRELAEIVEGVVRAKPGEIHPATRTFQALRMFLNGELDEVASALAAAERILAPGGRLVVISFHSLEDRVVKRFLAARGRAAAVSRHQPLAAGPAPTFRILTPRAVIADADEVTENPRARSAKLRAAERTDAPASGLPVEAVPCFPRSQTCCGGADMLRVINIVVVAALVGSAAWVYKIKFEATVQAESVARLRSEIRRERDMIATLRAEWSRLDSPERLQELAQRHLKLRPVEFAQFDRLDNLPERPKPIVPPGTADPIGAIIETFADAEVLNGTLPDRSRR
jgi:16S rRNA (cytosine1402-N4)-methyltransferase